MIVPSKEWLSALRGLINSRGLMNVLLIGIIGWVMYTIVPMAIVVPGKLDIIISKLNTCVERRVAHVLHR